MRDDLRRFLANANLIELAVAVAIGFAGVQFLSTLAYAWVRTPVLEGAHGDFGGGGTGYVAIFGREFDWLSPLIWTLVLAALLAVVGIAVRFTRDELFEGPKVECPHCLAAIPAEARVCSYCTRDVAPA